ncbi:MAG: hypothetical protein FWH04_06435 [Oscillospiraceae bacterium]|nr:hypothetical protein [Oscillospiraceae bacterium]
MPKKDKGKSSQSVPSSIREPHKHSSLIKLDFNDTVREKLYESYGDTINYVIEAFEACPPEIKLTVASLFDIPINTEGYPDRMMPQVRFTSPFMTVQNMALLTSRLDYANAGIAISIYNACPPEQVLIAAEIARLKNSRQEND